MAMRIGAERNSRRLAKVNLDRLVDFNVVNQAGEAMKTSVGIDVGSVGGIGHHG
jgi:hypothetical protein